MRINPSGIMIGTTSQLPGYSLTVSGGSLLTAPVLFGTQSGGNLDTTSNSFRISTVLATLSTYDVYLQTLGVNTNLFIGTGGTGTARVQIDPVGNVTLLNGNLATPTASSNTIGGVTLRNQSIISNLSLQFVTSGTSVGLTLQNRSTTFILTPSVTGTISSIQAPSLASSNIGASWTIKNASLGATTNPSLTFTNGTILNSSTPAALSFPGNAMVTIVYSGTGSNYYIL